MPNNISLSSTQTIFVKHRLLGDADPNSDADDAIRSQDTGSLESSLPVAPTDQAGTSTGTFQLSTSSVTINPPIVVINTVADLENISNNPAGDYVLGADIDAANYNFIPIANFSGVLDGQGHSIENLTINSGHFAGLFGRIDVSGEVKNVNLVNVNISGLEAGALANENDGSIVRSSVTGTIISFGPGALVEYNLGSITNSYSQANLVSLGGNFAGGLVALNGTTGSISGSYATGSVSCSGGYATFGVGGLVGENDGLVIQSYAMGALLISH